MKTKIYMLLIAVMSVITLASCDEHEPFDTNIYPGYVLCDDHKVMSLDEYKCQDRSKAVGVVFSVANEEHGTYAVMLNEIKEIEFSDSIMDQGTSKSVTALDGNTNTVALQNSGRSPMADMVFYAGEYGQSAYIPSLSEMRLLVSALPTVNKVLKELGGQEISQTGADGWYWTSTEVETNSAYQAWLMSASTGSYIEAPKTGMHSARAIISIY